MANPVVRFDIGCKDRDRTVAFYRDVFGWSGHDTGLSTEVSTGEGGIDGAITALGHEPHNYVMVYMQVADCDAHCEKIKAAGGEIEVGPIDIPGDRGRFAWFKDPEGNRLAIFQPPAE
ncbi:VOC family protein [Parvularcula lutaonensis]|uniref:VOC family protein n=1 Tax=Parvularcula lutaonensis TaxID=491923 RepID=A0ABV7MDV7_9PROT|nr:VOC family protein [Parvularcula lutaonensis]GGY53447.1 hypothetical protein GCM10007148_23370 [Parvularcula lutaonensis]